MTDLTDLQKKANEILSSMDRERESGRSVYKRSNNWASDLMHPCIRYLTYSRLNWEDKKLIDINGLYRIEEGSNVERNLSREFTDLGFELELVQQYFSWDKYQIAGKIDGKIRVNGDRFPVEIKSIAPHFWATTKTIEDVKNHSSFWVRKHFAQLNIYDLMDNSEFGFLALKTFGKRPRILPCEVDLDIGEMCIKNAEAVNAHVEKGELPDRIEYDSSICDLCGFEHICQPLKTTKYDASIDEEDYKKFLRYFELRDAAKEYEKLDKALKAKFKGSNAIHGDVEVQSKPYEYTSYPIPDNIKSKFAEKKQAFRTKFLRVD